MNVMELVATLTLDTKGYEGGLDDAEKKGSKFGGGLKKAAKGAAIGMAAITGATVAAGGALVKGAGQVAEYGDNIDKMSQKMGMSAEAYQEWDAILQHSGTSIEAMKPSMKTLANAAQKGAQEFEALGISQEEVANLSQEELFAKTIEGLQNMEEGTERTAIASKLLGRGATELGALLNTSAEDTEAMRKRVHELGGVMSDEAVKAAAKYQDSLQDMTTAIDGAKRNLMGTFLPSITTVMDGISELFSGNTDKGLGMIREGISKFIENMMNAVPKLVQIAGGLVSALGQAIIENLPKILEAGIKAILELSKGLSQGLPEIIPKMVEAILTMVDTLLENIDLLVDAALQLMLGLAEGLIEAIPIIIDKIPKIVNSIVKAFIKAIPLIARAGLKLFSALIKNAPSITKSILVLVPKIIAAIVRGFGKGVSAMAKAGVDLMKGLAKGIINGVSHAISAARSAAGNVLSAIKGFFGIASPSKIMQEYGRYIDEGLAKGILDNADIAERAMASLGEIATDDFAGDAGYTEYGEEISIPVQGADFGSNKDLTVILELDKMQLGKAVYRLNNEETQRVGVKLSGAYA